MTLDEATNTFSACAMERIICHWTGGGYLPSSLDKEHYHYLVDGDGEIHKGNYDIEDNFHTIGDYAAHTLNCNSRCIGIAVCCMFNAKERPFDPGPYPLKHSQWKRLAELAGRLAAFYSIAVDEQHVLMHSEVEPNLGIKQRGKWDINTVPSLTLNQSLILTKPNLAGDAFRELVRKSFAHEDPASSGRSNLAAIKLIADSIKAELEKVNAGATAIAKQLTAIRALIDHKTKDN